MRVFLCVRACGASSGECRQTCEEAVLRKMAPAGMVVDGLDAGGDQRCMSGERVDLEEAHMRNPDNDTPVLPLCPDRCRTTRASTSRLFPGGRVSTRLSGRERKRIAMGSSASFGPFFAGPADAVGHGVERGKRKSILLVALLQFSHTCDSP